MVTTTNTGSTMRVIRKYIPLVLLLSATGCAKMDDFYEDTPKDILIAHPWQIARAWTAASDTSECLLGNELRFQFEGKVLELDHNERCGIQQTDTFSYILESKDQVLVLLDWHRAEQRFNIISIKPDTIVLQESSTPSTDLPLNMILYSQR